MKVLSPEMLYDYDYSIKVINALRIKWTKGHDFFSSIGNPKVMHLLLYLSSCSAEYTLKDGRRLEAKSGSLVYAPRGSEYEVKFYPVNGGSTVGVNFRIFTDTDELFLSDGVTVFNTDFPEDSKRFERLCLLSDSALAAPAKMKSVMLDILSDIGLHERSKVISENRFSVIEKGIKYLEEDISGNLSIGEIAAMCNISEIYFRKLFKEYYHLSPSEYRIKSKLKKAKELLKYEDLTVAEIAEHVGISDVAYFGKLFKSRTGVSPGRYRNSKRK